MSLFSRRPETQSTTKVGMLPPPALTLITELLEQRVTGPERHPSVARRALDASPGLALTSEVLQSAETWGPGAFELALSREMKEVHSRLPVD